MVSIIAITINFNQQVSAINNNNQTASTIRNETPTIDRNMTTGTVTEELPSGLTGVLIDGILGNRTSVPDNITMSTP